MPDADIMKWLWANAPNIAIAVGVAKLYYKVSKAVDQMQQQINENTSDIGVLIEAHATKHPEDLPKLYRRSKKSDG